MTPDRKYQPEYFSAYWALTKLCEWTERSWCRKKKKKRELYWLINSVHCKTADNNLQYYQRLDTMAHGTLRGDKIFTWDAHRVLLKTMQHEKWQIIQSTRFLGRKDTDTRCAVSIWLAAWCNLDTNSLIITDQCCRDIAVLPLDTFLFCPFSPKKR